MKVLRQVTPTSEQLKVINDYKPGTTLIRGAAGSGKTTTALLRLQFVVNFWRRRRERLGLPDPVKVLVLTFNRTLRGYISKLAEDQVMGIGDEVDFEVSTFASWAKHVVNPREGILLSDSDRTNCLKALAGRLPLDSDFLCSETEYVLGRFLPERREDYLGCKREGRGKSPRLVQATRKRVLDEIIIPYSQWKQNNHKADWNDLAVYLSRNKIAAYDIVVIDEAQDFSANEVRAVSNQLAQDYTITFVLDAVQRIYPRFLTWHEVGVEINRNSVYRLARNFRNTVQIAAFARPLLEDLEVDDDGTIPDFTRCTRQGPKPIVLVGKYSVQINWALNYIVENVDLRTESVAFLHTKGGGWFNFTRQQLAKARLPFVALTQQVEWPEGSENIALSTFHSAKGLEFDWVFILGLNSEVTPHGPDEQDTQFENLRRLLAMGIGRAIKQVVIGYKEEDAPSLVALLNPTTYNRVLL